MIEASKASAASTPTPAEKQPLKDNPVAPEIAIDEFMKVDLRVARIQEAATVEGADKLLRLTLDLGGETRTMFAGIKARPPTGPRIWRAG